MCANLENPRTPCLVPGQCKRDLSASQAKSIAGHRPTRKLAGAIRRRIAAAELADLVALDAKLKKINAELKSAVQARGSRLMEIHGVGPAGARPCGSVRPHSAFCGWEGLVPEELSVHLHDALGQSTETAIIMAGVVSLLAVVALQQDVVGAGGEPAAVTGVSQGLVASATGPSSSVPASWPASTPSCSAP